MPLNWHTITRPSVATSAAGTTTTDFDTTDAYSMLIATASTLTSTSCTIQVSPTSSAGSVYYTLYSGGAKVELLPASALELTPIDFKRAKIVHSAAEAATVTWVISQTV